MAGVTWWNFYFRLFEGSIRSPQVIEYLRHLLRHLDCRLLVVWDGATIHRSRLVRDFVREQKGHLWLESLPAYAPELNPVEYLWSHWKQHELPNFCPQNFCATESLCSQSTTSHAQTGDSGDRFLGTSRTVLSRQILLLVALTSITIAFCSARGPNDCLRKPPMAYELYSWQESSGGWRFCLLASPSGPNISAEQVFNKKFRLNGVKEVKQRISALPVGATIFWLDRITDTGQETAASERLSYPPADILEQVRQYAEKHHVEVQLSGKK